MALHSQNRGISGFLDGRQVDWINRIAGPEKGRLLSQSSDKKFLHIGVHRTGATFLQQVVFPAYSESISVFSDDVVAGKLFDNGLENVSRVRSYVGEATIIVVLRNQLSMINSAYRTYVKAGGIWGFGRFVDEIVARGKYDFAALLGRYSEVFGVGRVRPLFYEDMVGNWGQFHSDLLAIIGAKTALQHPMEAVNPGPTKYLNVAFRGINLASIPFGRYPAVGRVRGQILKLVTGFDSNIVKRLAPGKSAKLQVGYHRAAPRILEAYAESNTRLCEMVGRDLRELGYHGSGDAESPSTLFKAERGAG